MSAQQAPRQARQAQLWNMLAVQAQRLAATPAGALVDSDPQRFETFSAAAPGVLLDYSRQRLDGAVREVLLQFPDAIDLRSAIDAMFRGDVINTTEQRAALHVALRQPRGAGIGGSAIEHTVLQERERMLAFAEAVRSGGIRSSTDARFSDVINIGIGGSDLGPSMALQALQPSAQGGPRVHTVSNVDGCALMDLCATLDAATTLFIVASKTFTTLETMANAHSAREWLGQKLGSKAIPAHFAAVSVNAQAMDQFGVHPQYRFAMWDWVGGRYSLWSSIGVSLAIGIGAKNFCAMLDGAHEIDQHFRKAPWAQNVPVLMALTGVWNIDVLRLPTLAVLPYDSRLARFPAYLQQLEMESNGKSVTRDGEPAPHDTAPVVWGEPANNAQHSFFQLLHQGTPRAALDFLLPVRSSCNRQDHQDLAIANCLAQAEAFLRGQHGADIPPQKVHAGNRPSSILLFERLDPAMLGRLIALYEHKVYVQSLLWDINAFDQWGVELGKKLCNVMLPVVRGDAAPSPALAGLVERIQTLRAAAKP